MKGAAPISNSSVDKSTYKDTSSSLYNPPPVKDCRTCRRFYSCYRGVDDAFPTCFHSVEFIKECLTNDYRYYEYSEIDPGEPIVFSTIFLVGFLLLALVVGLIKAVFFG